MNCTNRCNKILQISARALAGLCILMIAMLAIGCGGGGGGAMMGAGTATEIDSSSTIPDEPALDDNTNASVPVSDEVTVAQATANPSGSDKIEPVEEPQTRSAATHSYYGPIFAGRTEERTNCYRVGDWLNQGAKRNLISAEIIGDASGAFSCQLVSGKGIGTYQTQVKIRYRFAPKTAGKAEAKVKIVWRTVPKTGTGILKHGTFRLEGYCSKLEVHSIGVGSTCRNTFLPDEHMHVWLKTAPKFQSGPMPKNCLTYEWWYTDGAGQTRIGPAKTATPSDLYHCSLIGGIAANAAGFKARRGGAPFTSGAKNSPNAPIGVRLRATLTLAGVSQTVEVLPTPTAGGFYFCQDSIDRLRQEYWDFNQNPLARKQVSKYAIPSRTEIGALAGATYGVGVTARQAQADLRLTQLRGLVACTVTSQFRNPRHDLAVGPEPRLLYGPHIYGNAMDVTGDIAKISQACKSLGWVNGWGSRGGAGDRKCYWMSEGDHIHIVY